MKIPSPRPGGFSLVEVTLALGIAAFCLIPLLALLPLGINSNRISLEQTAAADLTTRIVGDLQATPASNTASTNFAVPMQASGSATTTTLYLRENGTTSTTATDSRYRATVVTWPVSQTWPHAATNFKVLITWPPVADPTSGTTSRFETVISLNRN